MFFWIHCNPSNTPPPRDRGMQQIYLQSNTSVQSRLCRPLSYFQNGWHPGLQHWRERYWKILIFFSGENTLNNIMLGSPKRARLIRAGTVQGTASAGRRMVPACLTQPSSSGTSGYSFISYFNVIRVIARYCQVLQSTIEYSQVLSGTDWQVVSGGVRYWQALSGLIRYWQVLLATIRYCQVLFPYVRCCQVWQIMTVTAR